MKKILLGFVLCFLLVGCGKSSKKNGPEDVTNDYGTNYAIKQILKETNKDGSIVYEFKVVPSSNSIVYISVDDATSKIVDIDVEVYGDATEEEINDVEEKSEIFIGRYLMEFRYSISSQARNYTVMSAIHNVLDFVQERNVLSNLELIKLKPDGYEIESTSQKNVIESTGEEIGNLLMSDGTYLVFTTYQGSSRSHTLKAAMNRFVKDSGKKIYCIDQVELFNEVHMSEFDDVDDAPIMFLIHEGTIIFDYDFTDDELETIKNTSSPKFVYNKLITFIK